MELRINFLAGLRFASRSLRSHEDALRGEDELLESSRRRKGYEKTRFPSIEHEK
jgi:hypothetical protein